ncbi:MAG: PA14 domain-containing protein [Candidatus Eiseniibacteriota bacterium]
MSPLGRRPIPLLRLLALGAVLALMVRPGLAGELNGGDMEELKSGLKVADPQPDAAALKPGLAVNYHMGRFQTLGEMMGIVGHSEGDKGKPLPMLNYKGDEGANVMTSDRHDMVGAIIKGFIKFPQPGTYVLKVMSNDGISLDIGGRNIFEDGSIHPTDYSDGLPVKIDAAGWYPLHIKYFQKKGGYALGLFWRPPSGSGTYVPVPAEMYAHLEK